MFIRSVARVKLHGPDSLPAIPMFQSSANGSISAVAGDLFGNGSPAEKFSG